MRHYTCILFLFISIAILGQSQSNSTQKSSTLKTTYRKTTFYRSIKSKQTTLSSKNNKPKALITQKIAEQDWPNIDFEQGNFIGWTRTIGRIDTSIVGHPIIWDSPITVSPLVEWGGSHRIISLFDGDDTYGGSLLPRLCPSGGHHSLMLGNATASLGAEKISYRFKIPQNKNKLAMRYYYSTVLEDPRHDSIMQPRFRNNIYVIKKDINNNDSIIKINCACFDHTASSRLPGFDSISDGFSNHYIFKPWTPVTINLSNHAGDSLIIEFTNQDCAHGAHFAYSYVDIDSTMYSMEQNLSYCANSPITLIAPPGYQSYNWYKSKTFTASSLVGMRDTITVTPSETDSIYYAYLETFNEGCNDTLIVHAHRVEISSTENKVVCINALPFRWNGMNCSSDSTYHFTRPNILGCDSTATLKLSIGQPPVIANRTETICSHSFTGITLSAGTSVPAATYNITKIDTIGAIASSGNPTLGNGLGADVIADDSWKNTGNDTAKVVYSIVPVTADGCEGNPFYLTLNILPAPKITNLQKTICSGSTTDLILPLGTINSANSFNIIDIQKNGLIETAGNPTIANNQPDDIIRDDKWTNTSSTDRDVIYTIVPNGLNGCPGEPFTATITVRKEPLGVNSIRSAQCSNSSFSFNPHDYISNNTASDFTWKGTYENGITGGQSTGNGLITDKLSNLTNDTLNAVYTITPTAIGSGCVGKIFTITVPILPEPIIQNISASVCSYDSCAITLTSGNTYNIVDINPNGLQAISTNAVIKDGVSANAIFNDRWINKTSATGHVIYRIVPISISGCLGAPFQVNLAIKPIANLIITPTSQTICNHSSTSIKLSTNITEAPSSIEYNWISYSDSISGFSNGNGDEITQTLSNATNAPAVVSYLVTANFDGCKGETDTINITVNPTPKVTATPASQTICNGETTNIALSTPITGANVGYSWTATLVSGNANGFADGSGNNITQTLTNTTLTSAIVRYTITPKIGSCDGSSITVDITVNPSPNVTAIPASETICNGDATNIALSTAIISPRVSYLWTAELAKGTASGFTSASGDTIAQILSNSSTSPAIVRYTITPKIGSCTGNTITVDITVNPTPNAIATPTYETICNGATTNISLSTSIADATVNYSWTATLIKGSATGFTSGTGMLINQSLSNDSNSPAIVRYYVVPSIGNCKGDTITADIIINPELDVVATPASTIICNEDSTKIQLSTSVNGASVEYSWETALLEGNASGFSNGTGDSIYQQLKNTSNRPAVVRYTITPSIGSCHGKSQNIDITILPTADVIIAPSASTICNNDSTDIALSTSVIGKNVNYSWTAKNINGNVSGFTDGMGKHIQQKLTNNSNYPAIVRYMVTPSIGGCNGISKAIDITVRPTADVIATLAKDSICSEEATHINLSSNIDSIVVNYSWTALQSNGMASGFSSGKGNLIHQTLTNTSNSLATIRYTIVPTIGTCEGTPKTVDIVVKPIAKVIFTPQSQTICNGSVTNIVLSSNITDIPASYLWTAQAVSGNVTGFKDSIGNLIAQKLTNSGNTPAVVRYTATPSIGNCTGTPSNVDITINPNPTAIANPSSQTICGEMSTLISLSTNISGTLVDYSWNAALINGQASGFSSGSGKQIIQKIKNNSGLPALVRYTITPTINSCIGTPITVDVIVNSTINAIASPSNQEICNGGTTNISLSSNSPDPTTFSWEVEAISGKASGYKNGTGKVIAQKLTNNEKIPAVIRYTVISKSINGCFGEPTLVDITVLPTPDVVANPSIETICDGATTFISLSSNVTGAQVTYNWSAEIISGDVNGFSVGSGNTISQTLTTPNQTPALVRYTVTPTIGNCSGIPTTVDVHVRNLRSFSASDSIVCSKAFPITWRSVFWESPGDSVIMKTNCHGCDSIITLRLAALDTEDRIDTIYIFSGEKYVINNNEYTQEGTYNDQVLSNRGCYYNVTTVLKYINVPNTITPNGDGLNDIFMKEYHVKIFNRNGILLFEGNNGWDGTHNNKPVLKDTYFYVLYYDRDNDKKTKEGYVTVVRGN